MFEMHVQPRYSELSEAREQLNRRLDIYTQQYKAKEAQYAELGIVRKRNLEKVLRTLQRQGKFCRRSVLANHTKHLSCLTSVSPTFFFPQKPLPPPAAKPCPKTTNAFNRLREWRCNPLSTARLNRNVPCTTFKPRTTNKCSA